MIFQPGQTVLFVGDSITDAGRRAEAPPYGRGYVSLCRSFLLARYPELGLKILNCGIGGNTVRDLQARWNEDVLAPRPDWVSVKIGINDVWRRFGGDPYQAEPLEEYLATLRELLLRARDTIGARLIVMEPYVIEADTREPMRREMDRYTGAVDRLAGELDAVLVRTQAAFDEVLRSTTPSAWAGDRIHPGEPGHAVIAIAWLRAVGFEI